MKTTILHFCLLDNIKSQPMDGEVAFDVFKQIFDEVQKLLEEPEVVNQDIYYIRLYLLVFNAYRYEKCVKKKIGYLKRVSRQLKNLSKRYGNFYFCYLPMNHGTVLPRPYSLFIAIKEVLINSNKPATRVLRTNLLMDLLHSDQTAAQETASDTEATKRDYLTMSCNELESLSELNLTLMKCSRELIIQGVKDFEVMSTVFRVMETVVEDGE